MPYLSMLRSEGKIRKYNCYRVDSLHGCNCQRTVLTDTEFAANMSIFWLMICEVVARFYRVYFKISLSSRLLLRRGRLVCMNFSVTLSNPLNPYSHDIDLISTAISENDTPHSRWARYCFYSIEVQNLLISIFYYYSMNNTIFCPKVDISKHFANKIFIT